MARVRLQLTPFFKRELRSRGARAFLESKLFAHICQSPNPQTRFKCRQVDDEEKFSYIHPNPKQGAAMIWVSLNQERVWDEIKRMLNSYFQTGYIHDFWSFRN